MGASNNLCRMQRREIFKEKVLMASIEKYSEDTFEKIKHLTDDGQEYWLARELQAALGYAKWGNFAKVIDKAKEASKSSGNAVDYHFADVGKTIAMPKGAEKEIDDMVLSRYACYLIVQNGDPRKKAIALGQTYFAIKTREKELDEIYDSLSEDEKRLSARNELAEHNKSLADAAHFIAGIQNRQDYAIFQNKGYQGLYGGLGVKDIHARKGLNKNQKILDHMGGLVS
jgi:DNA-damage-inducible protein D